MSFTDEQKEMLKQNLSRDHVKKADGIYGEFIEGWHAISEANRIFGFDGWSYEIISTIRTCSETNQKGNHVIGYMCTVKVYAGGVSREDIGHGSGVAKSLSDAHENAVKEAVTDGLKRALRSFGNQFGLALYDKAKTNVSTQQEIEVGKASAKTMEVLLNKILDCKNINALEALINLDDFKAKAKNLTHKHKSDLRNKVRELKEQLPKEVEAA